MATTRPGRDGRSYPAAPLTLQERGRARLLAYRLVCGGRPSVRAAEQMMAEDYGVRRSTGAIYADLAGYECRDCRSDPEHANT